MKLRRRSEQQAATVWINFVSDFCCGQHKNSDNLDCSKSEKRLAKRNVTFKKTAVSDTVATYSYMLAYFVFAVIAFGFFNSSFFLSFYHQVSF